MSNLIKLSAPQESNRIEVFKNRVARDCFHSIQDVRLSAEKTHHDAQLDDLNLEIVQLKGRMDELSIENARNVDRAYQKGFSAGKDTVLKDEAAALDILKVNIQEALKIYRKKLSEVDQFALLASTSILKHIFSDTIETRNIVARALQDQVKNLDRNLIVSVKASSTDFADLSELTALLGPDLREKVEVSLSQSMPSGGFEIELMLGHLEFSLAQSLGEVQALVDKAISEKRRFHD